MREHFLEKLRHLFNDVHEMGKLSKIHMEDAILSIINMDKDLALKVIESDNVVNQMQVDIENELTSLMATESPIVASDLRDIIASLKIVSNIERIADYAVHISKSVFKVKGINKEFKSMIVEIKRIGMEMFDDLLDAYIKMDADAAMRIGARDAEIDSLHDRFAKKLYDVNKSDVNLEEFAALIFIIRYLERFGDQIKNICECIIFGSTNEHREL